MEESKKGKRISPILIVVLLTVFLHLWAVSLLPQDYDEPVYLQNAFEYAEALRTGGWEAVVDYSGTSEHPAFVKLLYASTVLILGDDATWVNSFYTNRAISALFGILSVILVALTVDPLSGAFLALNTMNLKYTSQVYLEAVPQAMTIAAVVFMLRLNLGRPGKWLWLSAITLGIAAASKYSYIPVILVVLAYIAIFERKIHFKWLLLYAATAMATFFFLNVHLWHHPIDRLLEAFTFHTMYAEGTHVQEVGYPWYQPLIWIFTSSPASWHPQVFFYYGFDAFFAVLAFAGIPRELKERRWLVVWLIAGIIFLLIWPTKWPQYILTITPAICLMAAGTMRQLIKWLQTKNTYWEYLQSVFPAPGKGLWFAVGAFILFLLVIYISAAAKLAIGRIGWSSFSTYNSPLPNNTVNAIVELDDDRILLGTNAGAVFWSPAEKEDSEEGWEIWNQDNSGLSADEILAIAVDTKGNYWFGTSAGLNMYDGTDWTTYRMKELGTLSETILCLTETNNGRMYAGTLSGATVFDGDRWEPVEQADNQAVFSFAASPDAVWMSVPGGVWQLPLHNGYAVFHPLQASARHLSISSNGWVWAATTGAGLAFWNGTEWGYFTTANSDIPYNTVNWVEEIAPDLLWVASAYPNAAGGVPASVADGKWHSYLTNNSGSSGSEPITIAYTHDGQVWIGTRSKGIDVYQLGR